MLTPIPLQDVRFTDGYLGDRVRTNRRVTLLREYEQCRSTGRLDAWTWQPGQPNTPHPYWDSDVAKWMEAAAYSLAADPDPELAARLDAVIERLAAAQEADGYLNSYVSRVEPQSRWTNLRDRHELYCAGHLIEAAVADFQARGTRRFLDIVCRYADLIAAEFGRGPGQRRGYPGHEEIELALVRLYRVTGDKRYADLAAYFVHERGQQPHYFDLEARARGEDPGTYHQGRYEYLQAHLPAVEQASAEGHAVRAVYFYAGMVDVAAVTGDQALLAACQRIWRNLSERRMYLTGGIGSSGQGERFTVDYDLPDDTAYAETCAAIGLIFFAHRLLQLEGDGVYADVLERALYNGVLGGVSLDGESFFYANPLRLHPPSHGFGRNRFPAARQAWFGCSCCPPNIARFLASLGQYVYSTAASELWVHLYAAGSLSTRIQGQALTLTQTTAYPWDGTVALDLSLSQPLTMTLVLRLPGWVREPQVLLNGERLDLVHRVRKGYVHLRRTWQDGDTLLLDLPMPVERIHANPRVRQACGQVALQRGPVVYCLEEEDNGPDLAALSLPVNAPLAVTALDSPWAGVPIIRGSALRLESGDWGSSLYRAGDLPTPLPVAFAAVPYCLRANRGVGEMTVWIREG